MKSLFTEDERYTEEGLVLVSEVFKALKPIYESWSKKGFSLRDISHITMGEAITLEAEFVLGIAVKKRKNKA